MATPTETESATTPVLQSEHDDRDKSRSSAAKPKPTKSPGSVYFYCVLPGCRIFTYASMTLAFICSGIFRTSLAVAIVAMVNTTTCPADVLLYGNISSPEDGLCPRQIDCNGSYKGEFDWTKEQQGIILSASSYGYEFTQIPAGLLADRYGGKWFLVTAVVTMFATTLASPAAARVNFILLIAVRVLFGLGDGFLSPSVHSLSARWTPASEYTIATTVVYVGTNIGSVIGDALSGYMCATVGWPSTFYVFGMVCGVAAVISVMFIYNSPVEHPCITARERRRLEAEVGPDVAQVHDTLAVWRGLLTSLSTWAVAIALFVYSWEMFILFSGLPMFMNEVLGVDMTANGLWSAIPNIAGIIFIPVSGFLSDWLRSSRLKLSTTFVRKVFTAGLLLSGILLIIAGHAGCNPAAVTAIMFICVGFMGIAYSSLLANVLDLSGPHAGKLMGLCNTISNIGSIVAPLAMGALISGPVAPRTGWQNVFYLSGGLNAFAVLLYVIFGTGERQSWADIGVGYVEMDDKSTTTTSLPAPNQ